MNLLVCTLGVSWPVIPEIYAFLAPEALPLFEHHPGAADLAHDRARYRLRPPDEIWIVTTRNQRTLGGLTPLIAWWRMLGEPGALRVWCAADTDDLASAPECEQFRELVFRVCLRASETAAEGQLCLSLAGGRKTMSADLQRAAGLFGCHALLHVVDAGLTNHPLLRAPTPELLSRALPADQMALDGRAAVTPLVVGQGSVNDALFVDLREEPALCARDFPVPEAAPLQAPEGVAMWSSAGPTLCEAIARRESEGIALFGNYLRAIGERERHESWRSLYRLPPRTIEWLRTTTLGERDADLLRRLPKADLHCHLGGVLDVAAQQRVARAAWPALDARRRAAALDRMAPLLRSSEPWPRGWLETTRAGDRPANAMALLTEVDTCRLEQSLFGPTEPRFALKRRGPFSAYEQPGELSGSALLSEPGAIETYVREALACARTDGVRYVEWRCSPQKYDAEDPLGCLRALATAIEHARESGDDVDARLVVVVNRTQSREEIRRAVSIAADARIQIGDRILAVDVAGDETALRPEALAPDFEPVFRECLAITIHAGEGEPAEAIWEAAYRLHADRIGHGLTLAEHARLAERFRDRDICLELCPTSNVEVVGFLDPALPGSRREPVYPLRALLRAGVPLTLCTDNPGISRCTLSSEYLRASRMVDGLSLWEVLSMTKQAFSHAFAPAALRERMLKDADARIFEISSQLPWHGAAHPSVTRRGAEP